MIGIYARVSTEDQARKGYSLKDQVFECRKKAKTSDVLEYVDEISGEFLDRPALSKLRHDVKEGLIHKVICLDPDRLSRKLMNQLLITDELDRRGVELLFVNGEYAKTPEGQLFYSMRGAVAEFEKAKINERMSRGRKEKARQGKVLRDFGIYGYGFDQETQQIIIDDNESEVVKLIFDLFTKPNTVVQGMNGIAKYLTERKIPTKKGGSIWHRQVVRQILLNRAYIGEFHQNKWNTEGMLGNKHRDPVDRVPMRMRPPEDWIPIPCPAIIDLEIFEHAQTLLQESRRRWAKKGINQYLLSGLVRCGLCGNTMTGRRTKNWGTHVFEYHDIKGTAGAKNVGCGKRIKAEDLDKEVWETVVGWLDDPRKIRSAEEHTQQEDSTLEEAELARLEIELQKTRTGRKKLLNLFSQGVDLSEDDVRESLRELKVKEDGLLGQIERLKTVLHQERKKGYSQSHIKEAIAFCVGKSKEDLSFDDRQMLIRSLVREIRVFDGDKISIYVL